MPTTIERIARIIDPYSFARLERINADGAEYGTTKEEAFAEARAYIFRAHEARRKALAILNEMRPLSDRMLRAAQTAWINDPLKLTSTIWTAIIDDLIAEYEDSSRG